MAKPSKKKKPPKNDPKENDKGSISVNGSFMDILKASGKHANNNSAKKKDN